MNDRLKFRVWDNIDKRYILTGSIDIDKGRLSVNGFYEENRFFIEQCTGSKDKNGELAYHKDFIKNRYGDIFLIEWNSKECAYCLINIIYLKSGIDLEHAIRYDSISMDSELVKEWEVIGNIHQNSELLEKGGK